MSFYCWCHSRTNDTSRKGLKTFASALGRYAESGLLNAWVNVSCNSKSQLLLSFVNRKYYCLRRGLVERNFPDKGEKFFEAEIANWSIFCGDHVWQTPLLFFYFSPTGSPQGQAIRWHSGGRQSQKQRKRSKSNTLEESGDQRESSEGNSNETADNGKEEKRPPAW